MANMNKKDHDLFVVFEFKVCTLRASLCPRYSKDHDDLMVFVFKVLCLNTPPVKACFTLPGKETTA